MFSVYHREPSLGKRKTGVAPKGSIVVACGTMKKTGTGLFDTHVHLDFWSPDVLLEELDLAQSEGVGQYLVPGVDRNRWPGLAVCAEVRPNILVAPGLHPQAADEWNEEAEKELAKWCDSSKAVAIGEIGLDRLIETPGLEVQEAAFRSQLKVAVRLGLPVLIHCRKAFPKLFEILREERAERVGGIFHAFSGSRETAETAMSLGFGLGFGGPLTYPNARRGPEVLRRMPAEWIVLETDAPDLPPHPHRGSDNRPAWLSLIAAKVGEIREWTPEETARITTANARRILKLSE